MSDIDEDDGINIDDEVLIAIVQANPCLYAKSDPFYKDHKAKEMKWEVIAESLNCTGRLKYFISFENETVEYLS